MVRSLVLTLALLTLPALAADPKTPGPTPCQCGVPGCDEACTCSAGQCPLHRPKKDPPPAPAPAPSPKR